MNYIILGDNLLGAGSYFSTTSEYSARDMFSPANNKGERFMFLVRVITGESCKGKEGLKTAPYKPGCYDDRYNSVVDDETNPQMYAVFHDVVAYPDYIIKYKY